MSIYDKEKLKIDGPESLKARNAAHRLSMLLNEKFGVVVLPSRLREVLQEDWTEISGLAHTIHDGPAGRFVADWFQQEVAESSFKEVAGEGVQLIRIWMSRPEVREMRAEFRIADRDYCRDMRDAGCGCADVARRLAFRALEQRAQDSGMR